MVKFNDDDIKEVMGITGLDKDKATKLFKSVINDIDDGTDDELCSYDIIDIIKIENKAKKNGSCKLYVQNDKPKEKAKRETKLDNTKVAFIEMLYTLLDGNTSTIGVDNITIANPQKEITFTIEEGIYSLNLVKHRPPKK